MACTRGAAEWILTGGASADALRAVKFRTEHAGLVRATAARRVRNAGRPRRRCRHATTVSSRAGASIPGATEERDSDSDSDTDREGEVAKLEFSISNAVPLSPSAATRASTAAAAVPAAPFSSAVPEPDHLTNGGGRVGENESVGTTGKAERGVGEAATAVGEALSALTAALIRTIPVSVTDVSRRWAVDLRESLPEVGRCKLSDG